MHAKEEKFRFAYIDAKKDYQPKFIEFGAFSLIASQFLTWTYKCIYLHVSCAWYIYSYTVLRFSKNMLNHHHEVLLWWDPVF